MVDRGPRVPRAPRRTRLIALITLTVLTATGLGAEAVARASLTGKIEDAARSALHTSDLEVSLGTTPAVFGVLSGTITTVSINADSATVCELADIDVAATVHGLSKPRGESTGIAIDRTEAAVTVGSQALGVALAKTASIEKAPAVSPDPDDGLLRLRYGPVDLAVRPALDGSTVTFAVESVTVAGRAAAVVTDRLRARAGTRQPRSVSGLPLDLTPTSVTVTSQGLVVALTGGPTQLTGVGGTPCRPS